MTGSFSLLSLFLGAHLIVQAVIIGLILASVWSWAIIVDKTFLYRRLRKQMDRFEQVFWSGQSLEELYQQMSERPSAGLGAVFVAGFACCGVGMPAHAENEKRPKSIKEDKSMLGFLNSGDEWMLPLYDFRQKLKDWREEEDLRNKFKRDGREGLGAFNSETRQLILKELLTVERTVKRELIKDVELIEIQRLWSKEFDMRQSAMRIAYQYGRTPMAKRNAV